MISDYCKDGRNICKSIHGYNVDMEYIASHVCLDYVYISTRSNPPYFIKTCIILG